MNKEKMDVVEFTERVLGLELFDYQKELLRKVYTGVVSGQIVYIVPPRHLELGYLYHVMKTIIGSYYHFNNTENSIPETINIPLSRKGDKDECKEM